MKRIPEHIATQIVQRYQQGYSTKTAGTPFGVSKTGVRGVLARHGISTRKSAVFCKYAVDLDYFDKIDTERKAYWLGVLFADGCNTGTGSTCLALVEKDLDILQKYKTDIGYSGKILKTSNPPNKQGQSYFGVKVGRKRFTQCLEKHGMTPRKSLTLQFPKLEKDLIRHFIRGYVDGDGCFCDSQGRPSVSMLSSRSFIKELKVIFDSMGWVSCVLQKNNIWDIKIASRLHVIQFIDWVYDKASVYGRRKFNKAQAIKQKYLPKLLASGARHKALVGRIFSDLSVVGWKGALSPRKDLWKCVCSCGKTIVASGESLLDGVATRCDFHHGYHLGARIKTNSPPAHTFELSELPRPSP